MRDKNAWAASLLMSCVALGATLPECAQAAPVNALPVTASTTLTDRQQSATSVITVVDGPIVNGNRTIRYHVVYDSSASCHVVLDGSAQYYSDTDESGDTSEALPNGEWATTNQFRDNGPHGLVKLGMDVDVEHPRYVDFALEHPVGLPSCLGPAGLSFYAFADSHAQPANPLQKSSGKAGATYHNFVYDYAVDYPEALLVPGTESASGDGLDFSPKSGKAEIAVWGKYGSPDDTHASILRGEQSDCAPGKIPYEVNKPGFVAFSCLTPKGRIVYEKMAIRNDVYAAVRFEYDAADQATWGPVIKQMADSLRIGEGPKPAKR